MNKRLVLLIFLLFGFQNLFAVPDTAKTKKIAQQFLLDFFQDTEQGNFNVSLVYQDTWPGGGNGQLTIYGIKNGEGFVLVPSDPEFELILAFSPDHDLILSDIPPVLELILNEYAGHFIEGEIDYKEESAEIHSQLFVTPLLSSTWDQRCYYNDSCPADIQAPAYFCGHAPAGCVATAMAQIMHYYAWPLQGTSSKSYYHSIYGTLSANFSATSYNIAQMPDAIYSSNMEVAQLLYHCGVASEMDFGPTTSGTGALDARNGMVNYFGYSSGSSMKYKLGYSDAAWKALLKQEIDLGHPLFYGGVDNVYGTGHAWVCDGYYSNDHFHMNWGWSGVGNGYFMLSNLNPLGNENYINLQEIISGLEPAQPPLQAGFSSDKEILGLGHSASFLPICFGNPTSYEWTFDGGTPAMSTAQSPAGITYNIPGKYDVRLVVWNGTSSDTLIREKYITVVPFADFSSSEDETEKGKPIHFFEECLTMNPVQQYDWIFFGADQATSGNANPQNISWSNAGQYPVMLEVSTSQGTHKQYKIQFITVHNDCDTLMNIDFPSYFIQPANQPQFSILKEDLDGLIPYHTPFISSSWDVFDEITGNDTNYFISATSLFQTSGAADNWFSFGPVTIPTGGAVLQWKHKFPDHTKRDAYEVMINETGLGNQNFTNPPVFALADNDPATVGDSVWTKCRVPLEASVYAGKSLYFTFHHNASNMFYLAFDDINITYCDGYPLYSDFYAPDTLLYAGDTIQILNFSTGDAVSYSWQFQGGSPATSSDIHPFVSYPNPGIYDVTLNVNWSGSNDSETKSAYIHVLPVSVEELSPSDIELYPNPSNNSIYISGIGEDKGAFYQIISPAGMLLIKGDINEKQGIDIRNLSPGFYYLILQMEGITKTFKFARI